MATDNLENKHINESIQESGENLTEQTLNNPENAKDTAESIKNSGNLDSLADKEIKDVNTAKYLIKQKEPDLNIDGRKDYQIINQAKKIQKEMQALRRFENKKQNFEIKDDNPGAKLKSFSYKENNGEIVATINNTQEVRYNTKFTTGNESFDNKLDPQLKNYLDSIIYSQSLHELSFFLDCSSIFGVEGRMANGETSKFRNIVLEMRAKAHNLRDKAPIKSFFDDPSNVTKFINTFKDFSPNELNTPGFIYLKSLIYEALGKSQDFTFSHKDFYISEKLSFDYGKIIVNNNAPSCNMEIIGIDNNGIHLKNTVTGKETVFNSDTFKKAKTIETERKSQREYIENKEKGIRSKLGITEGTEITWEDRQKIESEMLFDAFTNDNKLFNILYARVTESNAKGYSNSMEAGEISLLLKNFNIHENINGRCIINSGKIDGKQTIQFDFGNTQIYFSFGEQPKITHKKVTQEEINTKFNEEEKSPNYKRALNIIETSKDSGKINLKYLNLTSKEVGNLFTEADLKNINNLEIDLSGNRISTIPSILLQQEGIKSLDLNRNFITEISSDIFKNFDKSKCKLEDLSLDGNNINNISEGLFKNVNKLKTFNISSNKRLSKLPDSIGNLNNLQKLNISGTGIEDIPSPIINCKDLESIYAGHCKLKSIPDEIGELTKIKDLYLGDNKISKVPDLSKLEYLEHLDLYYNDIDSIPELSFKNLKSINFIGCEKIASQVQTFKDNVNKNYPEIEICTKSPNYSWINTGESIKEIYFSRYNANEYLSGNPNEFFNDDEQYEQVQLVAESTYSGLSKAKQKLKIENNSIPIFYSERKRSDSTISMHVFSKKN